MILVLKKVLNARPNTEKIRITFGLKPENLLGFARAVPHFEHSVFQTGLGVRQFGQYMVA
jgi:hypothetical protein